MRYTDKGHFEKENGYDIGGTWFPRVTKILDVKAKPGLEHFFREVGSYTSAEDIKIKSAEEGSRIHETAEKILVGAPVDVSEDVRPAMDALRIFTDTNSIIIFPEFVERRLWSERHRYAGTIDALAMIRGRVGVLDIKTSTGFYPEYNLQTAAYVSAFQEIGVKKALGCSFAVETRWILRINQHEVCRLCKATKRTKGGRMKIRENGAANARCRSREGHEWGGIVGDIELREFPNNFHRDTRAFLAAKILWEWENDYWLRTIGYLQ